jgi:hypothetical protein
MSTAGDNPLSADPVHDRLLMGSPLRRPVACVRICAGLLALLFFAFLAHLGTISSMRPEATPVFLRALALSTLLSIPAVLLLWFLDRREREKRFLLVAAFLWGGLIATALMIGALVGGPLDDPLPRIEPLGPFDAVRTFDVPSNFRVDIAACEPEIRSPVAMEFDEHERLFLA